MHPMSFFQVGMCTLITKPWQVQVLSCSFHSIVSIQKKSQIIGHFRCLRKYGKPSDWLIIERNTKSKSKINIEWIKIPNLVFLNKFCNKTLILSNNLYWSFLKHRIISFLYLFHMIHIQRMFYNTIGFTFVIDKKVIK